MIFSAKYRLIEMCYAPSLRDMELKQLCKVIRSFFLSVISPRSERHKLFSILVKYKVSVHHGAYPYRTDLCQRRAVFIHDIICQGCITLGETIIDLIHAVCPPAVLKPVLPIKCARRYRKK